MRPARAHATLPLPPDEAWDLLVDARHHARWIPLTTVTTSGDPGVGVQVEAVTAGVFTDRMEILRADPPQGAAPGVAVFAKRGPVLLGHAQIAVRAAADGGSHVRWVEDVHLAGPLPRALTRAVLHVPLAVMMRLALRAARAEVTGVHGRHRG